MLKPDEPYHTPAETRRVAELEARVAKLECTITIMRSHAVEAVTKLNHALQKQDAILENMRRAVITESK